VNLYQTIRENQSEEFGFQFGEVFDLSGFSKRFFYFVPFLLIFYAPVPITALYAPSVDHAPLSGWRDKRIWHYTSSYGRIAASRYLERN